MCDAAVTMLRGGFFPFVHIALVAMAVMRFVMVAVVVLVERLMKHHVAKWKDIEAEQPEPTGDVHPMMLRPAYRDGPTRHAERRYRF